MHHLKFNVEMTYTFLTLKYDDTSHITYVFLLCS